ncbi:MAG: hypothetical protein IJ730_00745 [Alphaproteobacteria bacterium]|nr:hypothetical protein [Alphaproteobacteria bacterium]
MQKSSLKELLIFTLWVLTESLGYFFHYEQIYMLSVVVFFESYIFFQLPYSKYFWNADKFSEDLEHKKIRIAVMSCMVAFLIFVLKWNYFLTLYFIAAIRIDGIINFFRISEEEKHNILEKDGLAELKSYLYLLLMTIFVFIMIFGIGALYISKYFVH